MVHVFENIIKLRGHSVMYVSEKGYNILFHSPNVTYRDPGLSKEAIVHCSTFEASFIESQWTRNNTPPANHLQFLLAVQYNIL